MAKRNIAARKKLQALYVKGVEVRFDESGASKGPYDRPATEDEVAIWLQPPSPLQREMALREAQAARSRAVLAAKRDKDSEEHLTAMAFVFDMANDTLIDYVLIAEQEDRQREAMRDVLALDEWDDMTALQDAMRQFEESGADEDDPEYAPLLERDVEFGRQVAARMRELTEAARDVMTRVSVEKLQEKAIERRADLAASQVFMRMYERWMLHYSCRDPDDHQELFFEDAKELASQPEFVIEQLGEVLQSFIQDGNEAKNSLRVASSSESSTLPAAPETSAPSIPEEQSA